MNSTGDFRPFRTALSILISVLAAAPSLSTASRRTASTNMNTLQPEPHRLLSLTWRSSERLVCATATAVQIRLMFAHRRMQKRMKCHLDGRRHVHRKLLVPLANPQMTHPVIESQYRLTPAQPHASLSGTPPQVPTPCEP